MDNFVEDDSMADVDPAVSTTEKIDPEATAEEKKLAESLIREIKADLKHHAKAFEQMRRDMHVARVGAPKDWPAGNYKAPIVGRHVKMKTAALYAKNPKIKATRRETMDFAVWDENPATLQLAFTTMQSVTQIMQQAQQAAAENPQIDPMTGMVAPAPAPPIPPEAAQAQAILEDFQQGLQRRQMIAKYGKTLEILFSYFTKEQMPLDFKKGMKQTVRRACTTGVGYVELAFQRETGPRPGLSEELADIRARLDHMERIAGEIAEGDIGEGDKEIAELQASMDALKAEPEIVVREGLIFDYPQSTKVIPDRMTKILEGFVGSRRLTIEYTYTPDEIKELFGVDLKDQFTPYNAVSGQTRELSPNDVLDDDFEWSSREDKKKTGLVRVWKCYDKVAGLVYYLADGYCGFLRAPAAPDVFVESFWPVYALTFNAVESEEELFPPSDVTLLMDQQNEYNRSRQGMREHRQAARPRYVYSNGAVEEEDVQTLAKMKPFDAFGLNVDAQFDLKQVFQAFPTPGVDPNLYETGQIFNDIQLVGGAQEAQYGGTSQATATESAIAAGATNASDASAIDDLDGFISLIVRASGQILQREMSEEKVREIVGPGAVWPTLELADIAKEVSLDVEGGSTGKPNQAVEINNWKQLGPLLMQTPGINPSWFAKETIRRLDDKVDMVEALADGIPSMMSMNRQMQINPADAASDPNAQGQEGADNTPAPERQEGSSAAFGSNQV